MTLYSLAAAAAGVSMLALAQPAEGKVVVTRKTIIVDNGNLVRIDLNHDGLADFEFSFVTYRTNPLGHFHAKLTAKALTGGEMVGRKATSLGPLGAPYASALARGAKIGPSAHFSSSKGQITIEREIHYSSAGFYYGNWYFAPNHFIGVKFKIKGETHYCWIRMGSTTGIPEEITGFAYETLANRVITAGQTSDSTDDAEAQERTIGPSLGLLARGADALEVWRRSPVATTMT